MLAVGDSFGGGRDLSGVLNQAKNPYATPQIESALPPELSFKGAPSPNPRAKDGLRSACLICRVDSVDLNVPLKFITAMEVLESTYL